jgi:hypothetical protein
VGKDHERFAAKVETRGADECWPWIPPVHRSGYGQFWVDGAIVYAHRYAAHAKPGEIIDHACHNRDETCAGGPACQHRRCCNPSHLIRATHAENVARGRSGVRQAARTHCPAGHPYDDENTYLNPQGRRNCRTCQRASRRAFYLRNGR